MLGQLHDPDLQLLRLFVSVVECGGKSLRVQHLVRRNGDLLVDGFEIRFLGAPHPDDPKRLRALQIPNEIREALGCSSSAMP